jgi:hypothetical protein
MVFANPAPFLDECTAVAAVDVVISRLSFGDFFLLALKIQPIRFLLFRKPLLFLFDSHLWKDRAHLRHHRGPL